MREPVLRIVCSVLIAAAASAGARAAEAERAEGHRPFRDAAYWAGIWDDPSRRDWQKPIEVLDLLGAREGDVVADLGAGTGYFTGLLTAQISPGGKVYAVDIEPELLEHIRHRSDLYVEPLVTVLAEPDDPKLPEGEIDVILIVNTWHHIDKRTKYLRKLAPALAEGGRVALIDFLEGELPVGPPPGEKLPRATVVQEFEQAGWSLLAESRLLPYQYFLFFTPPPSRR